MKQHTNWYEVDVFMQDKETNEQFHQGREFIDEGTFLMMQQNRIDKNSSGLFVKQVRKLPDGMHPSREAGIRKESTNTSVGIDYYNEPKTRGRKPKSEATADINIEA